MRNWFSGDGAVGGPPGGGGGVGGGGGLCADVVDPCVRAQTSTGFKYRAGGLEVAAVMAPVGRVCTRAWMLRAGFDGSVSGSELREFMGCDMGHSRGGGETNFQVDDGDWDSG